MRGRVTLTGGREVSLPNLIGLGAGLLVTIAVALGAIYYRLTVAVAIPFALCILYLVIKRPFAAYAICLCMVSIVPREGHLFGFYVPYWTQFLIPALVLGAVLQRLATRHLDFRWADLCVLGFIILGYVGVFSSPVMRQWKWFTNKEVFPALLYFVARCLPYDRQALRTQLRFQLLAALVLMVGMVVAPVTGYDLLFEGLHYQGIGRMSTGVTGTIPDSVAYTSIWPAFFLYAATTALPGLRGRSKLLWPIATILAVLATLATTERTGVLALAVGVLVCLIHRRLRRFALLAMLVMPLVALLWWSTGAGSLSHQRLDKLREEGSGFERLIYRKKALDYMRSPNWYWLYGTGFGRLTALAADELSENDWVYDYNWGQWRQATAYQDRATHCAPITVLGEYGYGGLFFLLGVAGFVGVGFGQARARARRQGRSFDSTLMVAALAAFAAVFANGMYHNTEGVIQVIMMLWSFAGTVIGHPEAFIVDPAEEAPPPGREGRLMAGGEAAPG
jgi:hypothetical protein